MKEVIFLLVLGLVWIIFASVQDLKRREVANWLSFSLIAFALGFRFFYCLFSEGGFSFFYQGLIGLGIFFVIGNVAYYGRIFAGGDAKLMIALGTVLPFSVSFFENFKMFGMFLLIFLFAGALYGAVYSLVLSARNFKNFRKEFVFKLRKNKKMFYICWVAAAVFLAAGIWESLMFAMGALIFIAPYFYVYATAVEKTCMIKKIRASMLRDGDWLAENVRVGNKMIKASWDGLNSEEIKLIRKHKKRILVKEGIPFVPVFLISYLVLIIFIKF